MLVLVEDHGESIQLAHWLKRAGYQVLFANALRIAGMDFII
jgi:hypothetical protein